MRTEVIQMWYNAENSDNVRPSTVDTESSRIYNYIRKDFSLVPASEDRPEHYAWLEQKIKKEDWELYSKILSNEDDITDLQLALCELYEQLHQ